MSEKSIQSMGGDARALALSAEERSKQASDAAKARWKAASEPAILAFIQRVEECHFRTDSDTGANDNALMIWNLVREQAGLPRLLKDDLPAHCAVHEVYHVIRKDYGCVRSLKST